MTNYIVEIMVENEERGTIVVGRVRVEADGPGEATDAVNRQLAFIAGPEDEWDQELVEDVIDLVEGEE